MTKTKEIPAQRRPASLCSFLFGLGLLGLASSSAKEEEMKKWRKNWAMFVPRPSLFGAKKEKNYQFFSHLFLSPPSEIFSLSRANEPGFVFLERRGGNLGKYNWNACWGVKNWGWSFPSISAIALMRRKGSEKVRRARRNWRRNTSQKKEGKTFFLFLFSILIFRAKTIAKIIRKLFGNLSKFKAFSEF